MSIFERFRPQKSRQEVDLPDGNDFDVVVIGRAIKEANNDCGLNEDLACPDCYEVSRYVVAALRDSGDLGSSVGTFLERGMIQPITSEGPWKPDIPEDDPRVAVVVSALDGFEQLCADSPTEFAQIAVAGLARRSRLDIVQAA